MKKSIVAVAALATVFTCSLSVYATATHKFTSTGALWWKSHKESCTVSELLILDYGQVCVEVWDNNYNLDYKILKYERFMSSEFTSVSVSVSNKNAKKGFYAYTQYRDGYFYDGDHGWDY